MEKLRIVVLADLPVDTRHDRKLAREFKELLHREGFVRLQDGVFTRLADGRTNALLHEKRLKEARPETGTIRLLFLTEVQFQSATLIAGSNDAQEDAVGSHLDIFL